MAWTRLRAWLIGAALLAVLLLATSGEAVVNNTIRVGYTVGLTGTFEHESEDVDRGYRLWEAWVNSDAYDLRLGGESYSVELVSYDDESNVTRAVELYNRLIQVDNVDFTLGPYSSGITLAQAPVAEAAQMIMVEANGASDALYIGTYNTTFPILTRGSEYTKEIILKLAAEGAESIAIVHEDKAFQISVAEGAERWANETGLRVDRVIQYERGIADVTFIINDLKEVKSDILVACTHYNEALLFAVTAEALDYMPKAMVFTVGPARGDFVDDVGLDASRFIIGPTQWEKTMLYSGPFFGSALDFHNMYLDMWGEEPTYQSADGAAGALVLMHAMVLADSFENSAVLDALRTYDQELFYGRVAFDAFGGSTKPMGGGQIIDGVFSVVVPEEVAVAEMVYPRPPPTSTNSTTTLDNRLSSGAVIGLVLGAVLILVILVGLIVFLYTRWKDEEERVRLYSPPSLSADERAAIAFGPTSSSKGASGSKGAAAAGRQQLGVDLEAALVRVDGDWTAVDCLVAAVDVEDHAELARALVGLYHAQGHGLDLIMHVVELEVSRAVALDEAFRPGRSFALAAATVYFRALAIPFVQDTIGLVVNEFINETEAAGRASASATASHRGGSSGGGGGGGGSSGGKKNNRRRSTRAVDDLEMIEMFDVGQVSKWQLMALTEKIVSRLRDNVSALPAQVGDVCSHALACIRAKWDLSTSATLTSILQDQLGAQVDAMVRTMELDNLKKIQFELNAQNLRELAAGGGRRGVGADGLRQEVGDVAHHARAARVHFADRVTDLEAIAKTASDLRAAMTGSDSASRVLREAEDAQRSAAAGAFIVAALVVPAIREPHLSGLAARANVPSAPVRGSLGTVASMLLAVSLLRPRDHELLTPEFFTQNVASLQGTFAGVLETSMLVGSAPVAVSEAHKGALRGHLVSVLEANSDRIAEWIEDAIEDDPSNARQYVDINKLCMMMRLSGGGGGGGGGERLGTSEEDFV